MLTPVTNLPRTMPAAVYHGPHDLRVEDLPVPDVGPEQVLVEVAWCGVCGTDLHTVIDGWAARGHVGGHEWSGTVVAVGSQVSDLAAGDHIVGGPTPTCGTCDPCRARRPSLCTQRGMPGAAGNHTFQGAFARFKLLERREAVPVPEGVDLRAAALAEPLAVALHGLTLARAEAGGRAFVSGAGPIGALVIAALKARGVDDITVSEPAEARRDLARRLGVTEIVTPDQLDVPTIIEPMRLRDDPFDLAFECSGKKAAMEAALAQLGKAGTMVILGTGLEPPQLDPNRILLNELIVTGAYEYDHDGFDQALGLLARPDFPAAVLLEPQDVSLGDLLDACERLSRGEIAGKVLVAPGRAG